ncbi:fasciclin domain-containing protein [Algibacter miyuki]|uniref:Fasciclin domain-containing protein n=1 Tax=Algibacter miyuki TaxID=1306933 RepID=A0ABV5H6I3_9FLAO|nr:fasciclin domain-containing protein [Algibacter miyuki]MDN3665823.1 fasciclin domain-containing protein [Algibacter miyuki]
MKHRNGLIILFIIMATFGCKPDPLEYARPDNLAGTIYQQLESMGTFNYYLQALDKTPYKEPLVKGGSWTVFAPTDDAFEAYMTEAGISNFEAISQDKIEDIVEYSIVIDGWNTTTLTYFPARFYLGQSFRRRTQYKTPNRVFDMDTLQHIMDWDKLEPGKYIVDASLGRFKTTNYFIESYMEINGVEKSDYDYMFEGETFNDGDMKVFGSNVSQQNVVAENGIIYALDKVFEPKRNMYDNLSSPEYGDKYSMFRKMLERFATLRLMGDQVNEETGETETIYQFRFSTGIENDYLPFNPFDENYATNIDGTLAQGWGLLAPTNDALNEYLSGNSILGEFYSSYDDMPLEVLGKFISPFFFNNYYDICPSSFGQSYDTSLGLVDFKAEDIVDKKFCSNGFFVGVNTVYTNNSFGTIMGPLLLDPNYSMMLQAVQDLRIDTALQSKAVRFSILGIRNDQFENIADPNSATRRITVLTDLESYDPTDVSVIYMKVEGDPNNAFNRTYPDPDASSPNAADVAYVRKTIADIVLNHIIDEDVDFNANTYYQARSGEFVYTSNGNLAQGGGDLEIAESAQVEKVQTTDNGNFYEMSDAINVPMNFTYGTLVDNAASFSSFVEVLETSDALITIIGSSDKLINFLNLQRTFTLFAPNNTAVAQAISDGVIVEPSTVNGLDELEKAIAKRDLLNFAKKHFIQQALPTNGKVSGTFPSMYFSKIVDFAEVYDQFSVVNTTSSISITNEETGESVTTGGMLNILSKRVVIHEINNYIK